MKLITDQSQTSSLNNDNLLELKDMAVDLAFETFAEPTEAHIDAIQERLIWNARHGLNTHGAVTLH